MKSELWTLPAPTVKAATALSWDCCDGAFSCLDAIFHQVSYKHLLRDTATPL